MKYRVEFIKENKIEILKEFKDYDEAYDYSNKLIKKLDKNSEIIISENKDNEWNIFRKLNIS